MSPDILFRSFICLRIENGRFHGLTSKEFLRWKGAHFSKAPETLRARKAREKSRTLRLQSCFDHIYLIRREISLHTRSFRRIHSSVFRYRKTKNGFTGPQRFRAAFEKRAPGLQSLRPCVAKNIIPVSRLSFFFFLVSSAATYLRQLSCRNILSKDFHCSQGRSSTPRLL